MRLYVVTRRDLEPTAQAILSCRALTQFHCDYPRVGRQWIAKRGHLVVLAVPDEVALVVLLQNARQQNIKASPHHAASLRTQLVAVALESSPRAKKLVARIPPLAG